MIRFHASALETMQHEALATYPRECCGGLLGRSEGNDGRLARELVRAVPLPNSWAGDQDRHYLVGSNTVRELEQQAEREGLELIGFFHSHPDHPARPSRFDREQAWPWYTYVIISVGAGAHGPIAAWRLSDDRSAFSEEPVTLLEEA
jgi:proteasome lid subunit RPN8/RPN11